MKNLIEVNAKTINLISLDGLKITECSSDSYGNIRQIRIADKNGRILNIGRGNFSDSITVTIEEPPKKVKVFYLVGTIMSGVVDINKMFASLEHAEKAKSAITDETAELKIEEKEIEGCQEQPTKNTPIDEALP